MARIIIDFEEVFAESLKESFKNKRICAWRGLGKLMKGRRQDARVKGYVVARA